MNSRSLRMDTKTLFTYGFLFLFAFIALPKSLFWLKPIFPLVAVFHCVIFVPRSANIFVIWLIGLCLDLATGTYLGENCIAIVLAAHLLKIFRKNIIAQGAGRMGMVIFLIFLGYQLIIAAMQLCAQRYDGFTAVLGVAPVGTLLWLALSVLLSSAGRKQERY